MSLFQKIDERRGQVGIGAMILYKNSSGKFSTLVLPTKIPSFMGDTDSVDIQVTTSDTTSQIEGMKKLQKGEIEVYHHRDNMMRVTKLEGKTLELIVCDGDFVGERFSGRVRYKAGERSNGDATKATVEITPSAYYGFESNVLPLIQQTAIFDTEIPSHVIIDDVSKKWELDVPMDPSDATFTAKTDTSGVATVTATNGKLSIEGKAKGSCIVTLTSSGDNAAPWETTILVEVPFAGAPS